jgi:hypothetical protein
VLEGGRYTSLRGANPVCAWAIRCVKLIKNVCHPA